MHTLITTLKPNMPNRTMTRNGDSTQNSETVNEDHDGNIAKDVKPMNDKQQ